GDQVIGMDIVESEDQQVLAVSANGYGKRTPITEWRLQNRGGKGIIAMVTSERNGPLVRLRLVSPEHQIMVVTSDGQIIRTYVHQSREAGRNTQGVRVIRVAEGERVVDVEPVQALDEEEIEESESVLAADEEPIEEHPEDAGEDEAPSDDEPSDE